jgi:hypothetical protein
LEEVILVKMFVIGLRLKGDYKPSLDHEEILLGSRNKNWLPNYTRKK